MGTLSKVTTNIVLRLSKIGYFTHNHHLRKSNLNPNQTKVTAKHTPCNPAEAASTTILIYLKDVLKYVNINYIGEFIGFVFIITQCE